MSNQFSEAHRAELLRLVRGLKAAGLATTSVDAPQETLAALADQAEALAAALEAASSRYKGRWPFPAFSADSIDLPFSPISGPFNPTSPEVAISTEGADPKHVVARVRFSYLYEGPPGYVHGGWISAMFDQVLGVANHANAVGGLTGTLTVKYRRPTPIDQPLRFEAWPVRVDERKILTRGECRLGEDLLSECEGIFVRIDAARAQKLFGGQAA
jgi:acyl-coenzyme A thioesterase PaaI-like protein